MTRYFAVWVLVVLLAGCSTASTVAGRVSTHFPSPKETESPDASYTRQMCGRLEVAIQVKDLREATGIARRMAASGYPSSPGDSTVIDPKILVDAWALLDAYRHDDARRYGFALAAMQDHCRMIH